MKNNNHMQMIRRLTIALFPHINVGHNPLKDQKSIQHTPRQTSLNQVILSQANLRTMCAIVCLSILGAQWQVSSAATSNGPPTNASTDPNQPSLFPVTGGAGATSSDTSTGSNASTTGAGSAASCSANTGDPACAGAGNPINVMTGNKYQVETDLAALPGMMGIEITRHYNSLHMGLGQMGYGWRLGYEIDLSINPRSIHIIKADGSQVIFNRSVFNPSDCACQDPAQGHVMIYHTLPNNPQGDEYTWFMLDGKQLHFNHMGKLERIQAATGESVHLTRGLRGELLKVTDPQGRSLIMHYAQKTLSGKANTGFKGIVAIDTPVGRFNYQHNNDPKSAGISNLTQVIYPQLANNNPQANPFTKTYHYGETAYVDAHMHPANINRPQIPQAAHLLTGMSLTWQDDANQYNANPNNTNRVQTDKPKTQRQRTWMYDAYGRGILSIHGTPNSKEAIQQVKVSYHVVPLKGAPLKADNKSPNQSLNQANPKIYPRITRNGQIGQTIITNSQGKTTTYNYTLIAGEYRLLQVIGAGCAECAEPNIVYGYDKLGRQTDVTKVSLNKASTNINNNTKNTRSTPSYSALNTTHTDYDQAGRALQISRIGYINGKPQAAKLQIRYSYANTPSFPQLNTAQRAVLEPVQVFNQPSLIAKPSVIRGKEHQWKISYNPYGQPTQITETGYAPAVATTQSPLAHKREDKNLLLTGYESEGKGGRKSKPTHTPISRTTTYHYTDINGRSLLTQMDGALPNAYPNTYNKPNSKDQHRNTPQNSDITLYHYDKRGQYLVKIIAPNNVMTQLEYDITGTPEEGSAAIGGTGRVVKAIADNGIATQYTYANVGNNSGKILSTQRHPASLSLAAAKAAGLLQSTAMAYDVFGNTTMIKRTDGQAVYMQYGFNGKLAQLRDGLGNRVEWKDWSKGQQDTAQAPLAQTVSTQQWYTADATDNVARAWYFWHDDQQRITKRLSPDGGLDTWRYSDEQASDNQTGVAQTSDLDKSLQQAEAQTPWVQHIDPLNRITLNAVNSQGSVKIRMTPAGYVDASIAGSHDLDNTKEAADLKVIYPAKQANQISDDFGRVIQYSSPQHGTHTAQYDAASHITHITQADGTQIDYHYDVGGRLLNKTASQQASQPVNKTLTTASQNAIKETIQYAYNAFGLQQIKDANQTITYSQDALGRESDKATTLLFQNTPANKPLLKTYHIRTRYDALGHIKAKQLIDGQWLVFSLNHKTGLTNAMHLHKTIWPSLTNKLADWLHLPDLPLQIATKETVVTDIKAHPFNGITHLIHGNGISDDYSFDLAGRLSTVSHNKDNATHLPNKAISNTTQQPLNNKTGSITQASYTYDAGRRLVSETFTDNMHRRKVSRYAYTGWNQLATPPQAGLMQAVVRNTTTNSTATNNIAINDAMVKPEQVKLDQAGRTTSDDHYRYSYNVWGKLASVQTNTNNKTIATYQSNALGERIMASYQNATNNHYANTNKLANTSKTAGTSQTHYYLYDKQQRIAELDDKGNVLQQYLYINQTPVAVINTPTGASTEIISIHADRRNAPIAATDEQGNVIWQTQYDAWGKVINVSTTNQKEAQSSFNLSLRLPGQWQDQATGLHYNYQRDYNPDTGRYLTPDPLGFPDGNDPYAYVNNDPLNKADPLGLYEIDIHYYMTFFLAVVAGAPVDDARMIALATQYIDDNPATQPLPEGYDEAAINIALHNSEVMTRLLSYHFTATPSAINDQGLTTEKIIPLEGAPGYFDVATAPKEPNYVNADNTQLRRLYRAIDTSAKCAKLGRNTQLQFFGEYLHAFEDTFGHRDSNNMPIDAEGGLGHFKYGHNPDYTYDHLAIGGVGGINWNHNEDRTFEMEKEVLDKILDKFGSTTNNAFVTGKLSAAKFEDIMKKFNAIEENNGNTGEYGAKEKQPKTIADSKKIQLLQSELTKMGFSVKLYDTSEQGYNSSTGEGNRNTNLCANGKPLKQTDYPGTILPTSCS